MSCPICARDSDPKYRPFCSRRCADIDLGRWLTGHYVLPAEAEEDAQPPRSEDRDPRRH
ncbi:MAG: DNA gyrase inhibitor YacG [Pseudorhodobacter sp.]|nr:DNA gyrase inhibitor YacG [Pseudorhodobacter sp.]